MMMSEIILSPKEYLRVFLYLLTMLLLSHGLGMLFVSSPKLLRARRSVRYLFGFCQAPFVCSLLMISLAFLCPGAPIWLFAVLPALVGGILTLWFGRNAHLDFAKWFRGLLSKHNQLFHITILICFFLVLCVVAYKLALFGHQKVMGYDALRYSSEALQFADQRSLDANPSFRGSADGALLGDAHGFVFPAYLSHAIMFGADKVLGYPDDRTLSPAFIVCFFYMVLALIALCLMTRLTAVAGLAVMLMLLAPGLSYIVRHHSRDAFRMIPILLLAVNLLALSPKSLRIKIRIWSLVPLLFVSGFCVAGHSLGITVGIMLIAAWGLWVLPEIKRRFKTIICVGITVAAGFLIFGAHYLQARLETGSFYGARFYLNTAAVKGTALEMAYYARWDDRLENSPIGLSFFTRDDAYLSVFGMVAALLLFLVGRRLFGLPRRSPWFFLSSLSILLILPFLGVFNFLQPDLSRRMAVNPRYVMHMYPFVAACIAGAFVLGTRRLSTGAGCVRRRVTSLVFAAVTVTLCLFSARAVYAWKAGTSAGWQSFIEDPILRIGGLIQQAHFGRVLLEDLRYNYYLHNTAINLYSEAARDVLCAEEPAQVSAALDSLDIEAVVLMTQNETEKWWKRTALFDYLNDPAHAGKTICDPLSVYVIRRDAMDVSKDSAK